MIDESGVRDMLCRTHPPWLRKTAWIVVYGYVSMPPPTGSVVPPLLWEPPKGVEENPGPANSGSTRTGPEQKTWGG